MPQLLTRHKWLWIVAAAFVALFIFAACDDDDDGDGVTPVDGEPPAAESLRAEVDMVALRINGYIDELTQIGCVLKGFDDGLVDFHGKLDGRDIFLCWKLGEDRVAHWHELDSGFTGRQPVEPQPVAGSRDS